MTTGAFVPTHPIVIMPFLQKDVDHGSNQTQPEPFRFSLHQRCREWLARGAQILQRLRVGAEEVWISGAVGAAVVQVLMWKWCA